MVRAIRPAQRYSLDGTSGNARLDRCVTAGFRLYDELGVAGAKYHIKRVLDHAIQSNIVEPEKFNQNGGIEINERVLYVITFHLLAKKGIRQLAQQLPEAINRYATIRDALEGFCTLREWNLRKVPLSRYAPKLATFPLELVAMLPDLAEYENPKWGEGIIQRTSHTALFDPDMDPDEEQAAIARISRLLFTPAAEILGYRKLSGMMLTAAARTMFASTYAEAKEELRVLEPHIQRTKKIARQISEEVRKYCKKKGYDVEIVHREQKSLGKIVEKIRYRRSPKGGNDPGFSVRDFHDLVAFKVIFHAPGATEEDKMPAIYDISNFINSCAERDPLLPIIERIDIEDFFSPAKRKANGYRAIHHDILVPRSSHHLNFEIHVTTSEADIWTRRGGAAHFAYNADQYGGTTELGFINDEWGQMMDALRTGREDIMIKYHIPTVRYVSVKLEVARPGILIERIVEIPANRTVADALRRASIDITEGAVRSGEVDSSVLNERIGTKRKITVQIDPTVALSRRFAIAAREACGDVETAVLLSKYAQTAL